MADRQVFHTRKDIAGNFLALCNPAAIWSPRSQADVIVDIESGLHSYFVIWPWYKRTEIYVVNGPKGKYLRTDRDESPRNNLEDLPDSCFCFSATISV